jgi:hypothetical protein
MCPTFRGDKPRGVKFRDATSQLLHEDYCLLGGVDFCFFFGFSISYTFRLIGKIIIKLKLKRCFFFIFMSSYAEMNFLREKITK